MLFLLILSIVAPLKPVSWTELKIQMLTTAPDTVEVVESDSTEVEDER